MYTKHLVLKNPIVILNKGDSEYANQGWADAMARILEKQLPENKVAEFVLFY